MEPPKNFGLIIGTRRFPLDVHVLKADRDLTLGSKVPLTFRFKYRNAAWWGRLEDDVTHAQLNIGTDLGVLPFSAESRQARHALVAILAQAYEECRGAIRIIGGHMLVERSIDVPHPIGAVDLVHGIVRALVPLNPYIETIRTYQAFRGDRRPAGPGFTRIKAVSGAR